MAEAEKRRSAGREVRFLALGMRCRRLMEAHDIELLYFNPMSSLAEPDYETIEEITPNLIGLIESGDIGELAAVHQVPFQRFQYQPRQTQLFPIDLPEPLASRRSPLLPPQDPDALFTHVATELMLVDLFEIALKSASAEQLARVNSMRLASENANRMLQRLRQEISRARSERITASLLEIVSGYESVKGQAAVLPKE